MKFTIEVTCDEGTLALAKAQEEPLGESEERITWQHGSVDPDEAADYLTQRTALVGGGGTYVQVESWTEVYGWEHNDPPNWWAEFPKGPR